MRAKVIQNLVSVYFGGPGMMIKVTEQQTLDNLYALREERLKGNEKTLSLLVNVETGAFHFPKKMETFNFSSKKDQTETFCPCQIVIEEHFFKVMTLEGKVVKGLQKRGEAVLSETIEAINCRVKQMPGQEEKVLEDLSCFVLANQAFESDMLPGYVGKISRQEAEDFLDHAAVGAYLVREADPITRSTTFHISEENHTFLDPYLLTFVDASLKPSEILILHTQKGWTSFADDPDLNQPFYRYFSTPQELVGKLPFFMQKKV